jgi:hypothetical protein
MDLESRNFKEKDYLWDLGVDGRILDWISKKQDLVLCTEFVRLVWGSGGLKR